MTSSPRVALSTDSPEATERLAENLGRHLRRGDVLYLVGDLGAGKTCFVRGLARGLESADRVTSPTFVLVNQYRGRETIFHVDLYRTAGEGIEELGLWDHAERGVLLLEWPDLAPGLLPPATVTISFDYGDTPDRRLIQLEGGGGRGAEILSLGGFA
jgi:tRNA threonylcarbamoyladenosine biosynthesis protein TsaE